MVDLIRARLQEERRRGARGLDRAQISMRRDHGQDLLSDMGRGMQPGYPLIGRLKGLAELRGVARALAWGLSDAPKIGGRTLGSWWSPAFRQGRSPRRRTGFNGDQRPQATSPRARARDGR